MNAKMVVSIMYNTYLTIINGQDKYECRTCSFYLPITITSSIFTHSNTPFIKELDGEIILPYTRRKNTDLRTFITKYSSIYLFTK